MNADWHVLPLSFRVCLRAPGRFPEFKGTILRGAFGVQFRRTVCAARLADCAGCRLVATCAFPYVFDTPGGSSPDPRLASHRTHAPHPFAIRAPDDPRTEVPADTEWSFGFTLVGESRNLLPYFVYSFLRLEKAGLGQDRVPISMREVVAKLPEGPWQVYKEGAPALRYPPSYVRWPESSSAGRLRVRFSSLTRIKADGRLHREIHFPALARAALRRVMALHALYCGPLPESDNRPLLAMAQETKTVRSDIRRLTVSRFSTRTRQRMSFDGVVGEAIYEGPLSSWVPILKAAAQVNVGKGATFGFGSMEVEAW